MKESRSNCQFPQSGEHRSAIQAPIPVPFDVARFLTWALPVDVRRNGEDRLLRLWYETLVRGGVREYSYRTCHQTLNLGYLATLVGFVHGGALLDLSSQEAKDIMVEIAGRLAAVVEDHDIWEALG